MPETINEKQSQLKYKTHTQKLLLMFFDMENFNLRDFSFAFFDQIKKQPDVPLRNERD